MTMRPVIYRFLNGKAPSASRVIGIHATAPIGLLERLAGRGYVIRSGHSFRNRQCRFSSTTFKAMEPKYPHSTSHCHRPSTYKPETLRATDYVDISSKVIFLHDTRLIYDTIPNGGRAFPPGSHGFFYYYLPPGAPSVAGQIRFRLTPTSSPDSFHQGTDLLTTFGLPWTYHLLPGVHRMAHRELWNHLFRDKLTSPSVLSEWEAILENLPTRPRPSSTILYSLDEPFPYDFSATKHIFWLMANGKLHRIEQQPLFSQYKKQVFEGKATLRFERWTTAQDRTLFVIRVLKIMDEVDYVWSDYDGILQKPTEGSLLMIRRPKQKAKPYTPQLRVIYKLNTLR